MTEADESQADTSGGQPQEEAEELIERLNAARRWIDMRLPLRDDDAATALEALAEAASTLSRLRGERDEARELAATRWQAMGDQEGVIEAAEDLNRKLTKALEESEARRIYESWSSDPEFVPWVLGGNSRKQDEARDKARSLLSSISGGEAAGEDGP